MPRHPVRLLGTVGSRAAGFTVTQAEHAELPKAPPFVRPAVLGCATSPGSHRPVQPDPVPQFDAVDEQAGRVAGGRGEDVPLD